MIIYEVNVRAEAGIAEQYRAFLERHIPEILAIEGFESAEWWCESPGESGAALWTIHYRVKSRALLDRYLSDDAPKMRAEAVRLFGDQFSIKRRVLEGARRF